MAARKNPDKKKTLPPLKVVVMSATLDIETFEKFFDEEGVDKIRIPGRQFPVQVLYTKEPQEVVGTAVLHYTIILCVDPNELTLGYNLSFFFCYPGLH